MGAVHRLLALALLGSTQLGCSSDEDPEALFEELDDPTPNVLRGIYRVIVEDGNLTTDLRLRFTEDTLVGAAKCMPKNPAFSPMEVEATSAMSATNLGGAEGDLTVDALDAVKEQRGLFCQLGFRAGTYKYKLEELKLTLTSPDIAVPLIYEKIGD